MLAAWIIGFILAAAIIAFHHEVLHQLATRFIPGAHRGKHWVVFGVILLFLAHGVEMWIFAGAFFVADQWLEIGDLEGNFSGELFDYVYYSSMTYTTVGYGDIHPTGAIRNLASIEALVGLMMIAWSGAFTVFYLQRDWANASKTSD